MVRWEGQIKYAGCVFTSSEASAVEAEVRWPGDKPSYLSVAPEVLEAE